MSFLINKKYVKNIKVHKDVQRVFISNRKTTTAILRVDGRTKTMCTYL